MNHTFLSRDHRGLRPLGIFLPSLSICDKTICWNEHRKFLGGVFYRVSLVVPMHRCVWRAYVSSLSKSFHAQICDSFPSVKIDYSSWWLSRVKWLHFSSAMWSCNITLDLSLCVDFSFLQLAEVRQILRRLFFEMRFCNSFIILIIIQAIMKNPTPTHLPLMQFVMHWILDFKCQLLKSPYICQRQERCGARVINNDKPFLWTMTVKKKSSVFRPNYEPLCQVQMRCCSTVFLIMYLRHRASTSCIAALDEADTGRRHGSFSLLLTSVWGCSRFYCPRCCTSLFCSVILYSVLGSVVFAFFVLCFGDALFPWYLVFAFFPFSLSFFCYF